MRLELEDVSVYMAKNTDKSITMCEKMTQTDDLLDRQLLYSDDDDGDFKTPNGTSPCNHPSLSCQVRNELKFVRKKNLFFLPKRA